MPVRSEEQVIRFILGFIESFDEKELKRLKMESDNDRN